MLERQYEVRIQHLEEEAIYQVVANDMAVCRVASQERAEAILDLFLNDPKMYLEQQDLGISPYGPAIRDAEQRHNMFLDAVLVESQMMQRFRAAKLAIAKRFVAYDASKPPIKQNASSRWREWKGATDELRIAFGMLLAAESGLDYWHTGYPSNDAAVEMEMRDVVEQSKTRVG